MWRQAFLLTIPIVMVMATPTPIDGVANQEYISLPETFDVNPVFLPPKPEGTVTLPTEPTYISISFGHTSQVIEYFYAADDTVLDIFKFISERSKVPLGDLQELQHVTFNTIGRTYVTIPFSASLRLRDVPLIPGDELEVKFKDTVNIDEIKITPTIGSTHPEVLPGFFDVEFKVAGFPQTAVPIPRLAPGSLVRTIIEDRFALTMFTVDLHRLARNGAALANSEVLSGEDSLFYGILAEREKVSEEGILEDPCPSAQATVVTNTGTSHFLEYNCNTTASDVIKEMQHLGLVPEDHDTYGSGILVSTKGFFHEACIDTLSPTQTVATSGVKDNGMLFITVACPVITVYFLHDQDVFPQVVNCTSTIDYLTTMFWSILEHTDLNPSYFFYDGQGTRRELKRGLPIAAQLLGTSRKIVSIEYPSSPSVSPCPQIPSITPSPSPTPITDVWDASEERNAPPPEGAVMLGDGTTLIQSTRAKLKSERRNEKADRQ